MPQIPITVFTGFLGSGKTTIIKNIVKTLPADYKTCLLKNEFGDVNVDSLLLSETNIKVTEMINGCLCCILVGKLENALLELISKYNPDRIIIETSGSAFPAPIALEIKKHEDKFKLDGIINVIDVLNFDHYKDVSYTAKIQCEFTDLIVLNKSELVDEDKLERVIDSVNDLNSITPKVKTNKGFIDPSIIFGIDSKLIINQSIQVTDHSNEFDVIEIHTKRDINIDKLEELFNTLPKWDFFRIKGVAKTQDKSIIYNYVFGKWDKTYINNIVDDSSLLFIGKNLNYHKIKIIDNLNILESELKITLRDTN